MIKNILKEKYTLHNLKSWRKRLNNMLQKPKVRQPYVYLVKTQSQKKYKLLRTEVPDNKHLTKIHQRMSFLQEIDFLPKLVWSDEKHILFEYVEGAFPKPEDKNFVKALALNMVKIHSLNVSWIPTKEALPTIQEELQFIAKMGLIDDSLLQKLWSYLQEIAPQQIRHSFVYGDQALPNFILSPDNKLFFIDFGSFQKSVATDHFFINGSIYKSIDQECFREHYIQNGGDSFIFDNKEFLEIFNDITLGAFHLQCHQKLKPGNRKRKDRMIRAQRHIDSLKHRGNNLNNGK